MSASEQYRENLLERKQDLGRRASYRKLAELTGQSHSIIHKVLTGRAVLVPVNRPAVLSDVEEALNQLEESSCRKRTSAA